MIHAIESSTKNKVLRTSPVYRKVSKLSRDTKCFTYIELTNIVHLIIYSIRAGRSVNAAIGERLDHLKEPTRKPAFLLEKIPHTCEPTLWEQFERDIKDYSRTEPYGCLERFT